MCVPPDTPNVYMYIGKRKNNVTVLKTNAGGLKMREKEVEKYLVRKVKDNGGRAYKFESPGNAGVPDRVLILPKGKTIFVECKAPGGKLTKLQEAQIRKFDSLGHTVFVIDSYEAVDGFIDGCRKRGVLGEIHTT